MALDNPWFEESYQRLFGSPVVGVVEDSPESDFFFREFYRRFLKNSDIAQLFQSTDMDHQAAMLKRSLFQLRSCSVLGKPSAELVKLAQLHERLDIGPEMLDEWFEALIDTVRFSDPLADEATALAWCWAVAPGIFFMKSFLHGRGERSLVAAG